MRLFVAMFLFFGCVFLASSYSNAQEKIFYAGLGGSFQATRLDLYGDTTVSHDNAWGANARFGYRLTEMVFVQLDADFITGMEEDSDDDIYAYTGMASLKGYFSDYICSNCGWSPFVIAGLGIMHYDADYNDSANALGYGDKKDTDVCYKLGGGVDYRLNEEYSIGLEGNYTIGSQSVRDVRYFNFIFGFNYYY